MLKHSKHHSCMPLKLYPKIPIANIPKIPIKVSPFLLYASTWKSQPFVVTIFKQQPHCKLPKQNQKPKTPKANPENTRKFHPFYINLKLQTQPTPNTISPTSKTLKTEPKYRKLSFLPSSQKNQQRSLIFAI